MKGFKPTCFVSVFIFFLSSCTDSGVDYFPLKEGMIWQYKVIVHDMDVEKSFKQLVVNQAPYSVDGKKVFSRKVNDETLYLYQKVAEGVLRTGVKHHNAINTLPDKADFYSIKKPFSIGTHWQQETITGVLEVVIAPFRRHYALRTPVQMHYEITAINEQVKVPAGQFEKCLRVDGKGGRKVEAEKTIGIVNVMVESSDWYCPNVGLVKSQREEKTSSTVLVKGDFLMELESYSE